MINLLIGLTARIFSNSYINVFQKTLTNKEERPSVVNFYTYLGLTLTGLTFCIRNFVFTQEALIYILVMGILGALGNFFIIKALSCGELSSLAPINSYKPVVALIIGIFMLDEYPGIYEFFGICMIIAGTFLLISKKFTPAKAYLYRFLALIFSGTEAIFIKKVIILTNIESAFFYWAIAGLIFALFLAVKYPLRISAGNIKTQIALIIAASIMQYSTNYVFSKMNVAYALALFQLSVIVSVFLGVNIFKEKDFIKKLIASAIMITGAVIIIL